LNTQRIIEELEAEKNRLESAIAALQARGDGTRRRGRKPLTAEAKKRISDAQKKRWAKVKRSGAA